MSRPLVAVDLGGSLIRAAVATGPATHGTPVRHPTPAGGAVAVLDAVAAGVLEATAGVAPAGVAIGVPGPVDPRTGLVYAAPNLCSVGSTHGIHHGDCRRKAIQSYNQTAQFGKLLGRPRSPSGPSLASIRWVSRIQAQMIPSGIHPSTPA